MLGVAGCAGVELLGFGPWQEAPLAVTQTYFGVDVPFSTPAIVACEAFFMAFVEVQRQQASPEMRKYPGGNFDPAGWSKDKAGFETLKRKEIANGRLAMVAFLGILAQNQAYPGENLGCIAALSKHLADPWHVSAAQNALAVPFL